MIRIQDVQKSWIQIQAPRPKMFKQLFLDLGHKSWIQIQDPRFSKNVFWIQGKKPWTQMGLLDPRFSKKSFLFYNFESWILDPWALGSQVRQLVSLKIPSLRSHLLSSIVSYMYICKCICASICIIKCVQVDLRGSMIVLLYYIISHCVKAVNTDCQTLMPWHVDKPLNNACV